MKILPLGFSFDYAYRSPLMNKPRKWDSRKIMGILGENGFIVIFFIWAVYLSLATNTFLKSENIFTVLRQAAIVSIVAIGEMLVMLLGGMDVSLAAILGFTGVFTAGMMVNLNFAPAFAVILGVLLGGCVGGINGLLVTKVRINSVIATLGMMSVLNGIAYTYTGGKSIYGPQLDSIDFISRGYIGPIPVPVIIMFVFYIFFYLIFNYHLFGAYIYAIGNNEKASWLAGIRTERTRILAFIIAGLLAGVGGVMQVSRQGSALAGMGDDFLFPILTAVILGGISLSGGKGKIQNTLIASIFLVAITNGMVLMGISIYTQRIVSGLILIFALSLDQLRTRKR
jgi:ribose transport system permease protein